MVNCRVLETPVPARILDGAAQQLNLRLGEIFGLAHKSLEESHEDASKLLLRAVSLAEKQVADLQVENSKLRAVLDMQPNEHQSENAVPGVVSELHEEISSLVLPPGESGPFRSPRNADLNKLRKQNEHSASNAFKNLQVVCGAPAPSLLIDPDRADSSPLRLSGKAIVEQSSALDQAHESQSTQEAPAVNHFQAKGPPCAIDRDMPMSSRTECHSLHDTVLSSTREEGDRSSKCSSEVAKEIVLRSTSHPKPTIEPFTLLQIWQGESEDFCQHWTNGTLNSILHKAPAAPQMNTLSRMNLYDEQSVVTSFFETGILHPASIMRGTWDLSSLALVLYDIIMIPLESFFEPPQNWFTILCSWIVRVFWTLDIALSFVTGYYERDGSIVLCRRKIIRRYISTWFILDCLVVGVDWIELIARSMAGAGGYARIGKVGRSFRIIRMVRLLRLVRMREIVDLVCERINSEKLLLLAHVAKLMVMILMLAHIIACLWYGIGNTGSSRSWVVHHEFADKPWGDRYAMSLHWSIAQFAGGMDEVTAENPGERVFAMIVLMITFVIAALFVSTLTSSMTQLELLGSTNSQLLSGLRQYLHQKHISSKLSMRVQRNAQHQMKEAQRNMPEDRIVLLKNVSVPLRIELHFEIHSPALICHPFFKRYVKECPQVMRKVCHKAAWGVSVSAGDGIFSAGTSPADPQMYFITDGLLEYFSKLAADSMQTELQKGEWVAEAVLWVKWIHRGDLIARHNSSYCMLDACKFQDTVNEFHHHNTMAKAYAVDFLTRLNAMGAGVSDLHIPSPEEVAAIKSRFAFGRGPGARSIYDRRSVGRGPGAKSIYDRRSVFPDPK